jgi:hypothetical protein
VHVTGITQDAAVTKVGSIGDGVIVRHLGWPEACVEGRRVMVLTTAHTKGRRCGWLAFFAHLNPLSAGPTTEVPGSQGYATRARGPPRVPLSTLLDLSNSVAKIRVCLAAGTSATSQA